MQMWIYCLTTLQLVTTVQFLALHVQLNYLIFQLMFLLSFFHIAVIKQRKTETLIFFYMNKFVNIFCNCTHVTFWIKKKCMYLIDMFWFVYVVFSMRLLLFLAYSPSNFASEIPAYSDNQGYEGIISMEQWHSTARDHPGELRFNYKRPIVGD